MIRTEDYTEKLMGSKWVLRWGIGGTQVGHGGELGEFKFGSNLDQVSVFRAAFDHSDHVVFGISTGNLTLTAGDPRICILILYPNLVSLSCFLILFPFA